MAASKLYLLMMSLGADAQTLPSFQPQRAEEDWSVLEAPEKRLDAYRKAKYIPFGESKFLSIGGDLRERYEGYRNELFGRGTPDANGYWQQRFYLHGDLHLGSRWRFFGQLKGALQKFHHARRANDVNHLDLHQGFVEVGGEKAAVRLGRQEIQFGSARLTGVREGPNVRLSFDAVRAIFRPFHKWRIDAFVSKPIVNVPGVMDDRRDHARTFWGLYAVKTHSKRPSLDLYYFGIDRKLNAYTRGAAREQRSTFGARLWKPIAANRIDLDYEATLQTGRFGSNAARGWYVATETGYTLASVPLRPRLAFRANAASGDKGNGTLGTFDALFSDIRDYREQAFPGPQNVALVRPFMEWSVPLANRRMTLITAWDWYWRTSAHDGLYSFAGAPLPQSRISTKHYVGMKPSAVMVLPLNRYWTAQMIYSNLIAGAYTREAYAGKSPAYAAVVLGLRF